MNVRLIARVCLLALVSAFAPLHAESTGTWKTYSDNQLGIQLKYPPTWKTMYSAGSVYFLSPDKPPHKAVIQISKSAQAVPLEKDVATLMETKPGRTPPTRSEGQLGGLKAVKIQGNFQTDPDIQGYALLVDKGPDRYNASFVAGKGDTINKYTAIFDAVLKSFSFK